MKYAALVLIVIAAMKANEGVRYRFKKEARVLKAVKSPYVANLVEADVGDEHGYIALEFIDGKDLATALDDLGAGLPETLALQIVFTTTCWLGFEQMVPGPAQRPQADPGLAAYYTLTLVSPYVSRESRAYLDYLRAKYLG